MSGHDRSFRHFMAIKEKTVCYQRNSFYGSINPGNERAVQGLTKVATLWESMSATAA